MNKPLFIKDQTDKQLFNVYRTKRFEVERNTIYAYDQQGERVWLGEYCADNRAEKILAYICGWLTSSAGPENPIFIMPKS